MRALLRLGLLAFVASASVAYAQSVVPTPVAGTSTATLAEVGTSTRSGASTTTTTVTPTRIGGAVSRASGLPEAPTRVWSMALGVRGRAALAKAGENPVDRGLDGLFVVGVLFPRSGVRLGLDIGAGNLLFPEYTTSTGETWAHDFDLLVAIDLLWEAPALVTHEDLVVAPTLGLQLLADVGAGSWHGRPCATSLRDPACQRGLAAAETVRGAFAPLAAGGLTMNWGSATATLLATIGPEFASTALKWTGAPTREALDVFDAVFVPEKPDGVSLVAGLALTVGLNGTRLSRTGGRFE